MRYYSLAEPIFEFTLFGLSYIAACVMVRHVIACSLILYCLVLYCLRCCLILYCLVLYCLRCCLILYCLVLYCLRHTTYSLAPSTSFFSEIDRISSPLLGIITINPCHFTSSLISCSSNCALDYLLLFAISIPPQHVPKIRHLSLFWINPRRFLSTPEAVSNVHSWTTHLSSTISQESV